MLPWVPLIGDSITSPETALYFWRRFSSKKFCTRAIASWRFSSVFTMPCGTCLGDYSNWGLIKNTISLWGAIPLKSGSIIRVSEIKDTSTAANCGGVKQISRGLPYKYGKHSVLHKQGISLLTQYLKTAVFGLTWYRLSGCAFLKRFQKQVKIVPIV